MKIALIYLNDLFYNSGTAVIVRRLFESLPKEHEVVHLISPSLNTYASGTEIEISKLYQDLSCKITPYFLKKHKLLYYYQFFLAKAFRVSDTRLDGLSYAYQASKIFQKEKPDCIWCVLCHMPQTLPIIYFLRKWFGCDLPLHVSVYDPLELWPKAINSGLFYRYALESANSIDTIGVNFQKYIYQEFDRKSLILNDYIDSLTSKSCIQIPSSSVRVVIAGHIYSEVDIQAFLNLVSRLFSHTSISWYGNNKNYSILQKLNIPDNVEILKKGLVKRTLLVGLVSDFSFAYLSMPQDTEHFSRYSVPTKLVTYLESGLPVVFHAPIYSEVHQMNSQFGFGINLSDQHNSEEELTNIFTHRSAYQKGIARLYLERYEKKAVIAKFQQIVSDLGKK